MDPHSPTTALPPVPDDIYSANPSSGLIYATSKTGFSPYFTLGSTVSHSNANEMTRMGMSGEITQPTSESFVQRAAPINPPKMRGIPQRRRRGPPSNVSVEKKCPFCGAELVTQCTCDFCISVCKKGHKFYFHPETHQPIPIPTGKMPPQQQRQQTSQIPQFQPSPNQQLSQPQREMRVTEV